MRIHFKNPVISIGSIRGGGVGDRPLAAPRQSHTVLQAPKDRLMQLNDLFAMVISCDFTEFFSRVPRPEVPLSKFSY